MTLRLGTPKILVMNTYANTIIDALGGTAEVARICEIKPPSVSEWRSSGIPQARLMFLKLAKPEIFKQIDSVTEATPQGKAA